MLKLIRKQRIAVLSSHRAPGLDILLRHPKRKKLFDIACVISSEAGLQQREMAESFEVPVYQRPIRDFHRARGAKLSDFDVRAEYDRETVDILRKHNIDTVVLLGYLYIVTQPMLDAFPRRIINVHDSDLSVPDVFGEPKYTGLRSTLDAILDGATETRSTVHVVEAKLDAGPVLLIGASYPVAPFAQKAALCGERDIVKAYAYAQREWMMRESWGHLVVRALEILAAADETLSQPADLTAAAASHDHDFSCSEPHAVTA